MLAAQGKDGAPATGKYRDESITLQVRNTIKDTFNLLSKECPIPIIIKTLKNFSTPERRNSLSISGSVHVSRIVLMKRIANRKLADAKVPSFLPDKEAIKGDLLDYGTEIEWYDSQLSRILDTLKEEGELENTLIIVMADNGMPFPAAKATCFEYGIHIPMAICWIGKINEGGISDEFVSGVDLAPTILDAVVYQIKGKWQVSAYYPIFRKREKTQEERWFLQEENVMLLRDIIIGDIRAVH